MTTLTLTLAGGEEMACTLDEIRAAPELLAALKELRALYTHFWDRVDGGLLVLPPSMERFEKAFFAAAVAIAKAEGKTECICDGFDDRFPSAQEEATRICDDCGLKIIV